MMNKSLLKPGMLVKLRSGDICILAHTNYMFNRGLTLCWNDKSGRTLELDNYDEQLMYTREPYVRNPDQYDIMVIYDVGNYYEPFSMNTSNRNKMWERDKEYYSPHDRMVALGIKVFLNEIYYANDDYFITRDEGYLIVSSTDNKELLRIPEFAFYASFEDKEKISLNSITNFKENEVCQDTSTKTS